MQLPWMKSGRSSVVLRGVVAGVVAMGLAGGLMGSGTFGVPESQLWYKKPKAVCQPACDGKSKCILHACAYTGSCPPSTPGFCVKKCHSNQDCLNPDGSASGKFCNCESGGSNCTVANTQSLPNIPVNVCYDPTASN